MIDLQGPIIILFIGELGLVKEEGLELGWGLDCGEKGIVLQIPQDLSQIELVLDWGWGWGGLRCGGRLGSG